MNMLAFTAREQIVVDTDRQHVLLSIVLVQNDMDL